MSFSLEANCITAHHQHKSLPINFFYITTEFYSDFILKKATLTNTVWNNVYCFTHIFPKFLDLHLKLFIRFSLLFYKLSFSQLIYKLFHLIDIPKHFVFELRSVKMTIIRTRQRLSVAISKDDGTFESVY